MILKCYLRTRWYSTVTEQASAPMKMMILLCHLFLFVVKPKCPPYSYTVTGDICICNPGYYMNNTGKRACIRKYSSWVTQRGKKIILWCFFIQSSVAKRTITCKTSLKTYVTFIDQLPHRSGFNRGSNKVSICLLSFEKIGLDRREKE